MNHQITYNGFTYGSIRAAAIANDLDPAKVDYHLRIGNSIEDAFSKTNCNDKPLSANGIRYASIRKAADAHGLDPRKVSERIRKGWTTEQAF